MISRPLALPALALAAVGFLGACQSAPADDAGAENRLGPVLENQSADAITFSIEFITSETAKELTIKPGEAVTLRRGPCEPAHVVVSTRDGSLSAEIEGRRMCPGWRVLVNDQLELLHHDQERPMYSGFYAVLTDEGPV